MTKQSDHLTLPDDNWIAQLRKGWLELSILAVLWDNRLYGLEILRQLEHLSSLVVKEGTVYPVLARLRKEDLVEADWEQPESGHPRRYYRLTHKGRDKTLAMARHAAEFTCKVDRLIAPLLKHGENT